MTVLSQAPGILEGSPRHLLVSLHEFCEAPNVDSSF